MVMEPFPNPKSQDVLSTFGSKGAFLKTNKDLVPIYTDWANHYLEKCHKKRKIVDLEKDLLDSLLLVDVVESVTGEKVLDAKSKPKNVSHVIENISCCLSHVTDLGVQLDGVTPNDIHKGQLKSILGLFFSLSRWKQQQKTLLSQNTGNSTKTTALTVPTKINSGIPAPARMPKDNNSLLNNSRLPSPFKSAQNGSNQSISANKSSIDKPKAANSVLAPKNSGPQNEVRPGSKLGTLRSSKLAGSSGLKPPSSGSRLPSVAGKSDPATTGSTKSLAGPKSNANLNSQNPKMLEKFKLFGSKNGEASKSGTKPDSNSTKPPAPKSNRASMTSSSGFSSAKSDLSDKSGLTPPNKGSGMNSPKATFKAWANRGRGGSLEPNGAKGAKPEDSCAKLDITATPLTSRKRASAKEVPPPQVRDLPGPDNKKRVTKDKTEDDNDSAYAGCSSSSPSSSNAPSDSNRLYTPSTSKSSSGTSLSLDKPTPTNSIPIPTSCIKKNTGIAQPKPTVAVKGMTKPTSLTRSKTSAMPEKMTASNGSASSSNVSKLTTSTSRTFTSTGIKPPGVTGSPTVGVVSPMTHRPPVPSSAPPRPPVNSKIEESVGHQSDSNSSKSGRESDSASVIYRPCSSRSDSSVKGRADCSSRTSSRLETTFDSNDVVTETRSASGDEITAMEPLVPRASPYAYLKGYGGPAKPEAKSGLIPPKNLAPSRHMDSTGYGIRCAAGEGAAGYVSDGDAFTAALGPLSELGSSDLACGYMSEGGISLYAKKMQARFKEGLEAVNDNIRRPNDLMTDSFEDSSSLSSGLSENIDEISTDDLTGSSLSDHHTSAYHRLIKGHQQQIIQQRTKNNYGGGIECGQQTEGGKSSLYQRKLSQQENIDLLLQKCRTGSRGVAVSAPSRPKSESINGQPPAVAQYNALNSLQLNCRQQKMPIIEVNESPRLSNKVPKLPLTGGCRVLQNANDSLDANCIQRPGSAQGQSIPNSRYASMSGYHSLDRKRHLQGYFSESDMGQSPYAAYSPMNMLKEERFEHISAATLAMVSPRRMPMNKASMSLPVSHEGPIPMDQESMSAAWIRHNGGGELVQEMCPASPRTNLRNGRKDIGMSRSLIVERKHELKISPQEPVQQPVDNHRVQNGKPATNGNARLSLPPSQHGTPRMSRSGWNNGKTDGVYSNLVQKCAEASSPTSQQQLYLHRLSNERNGSKNGEEGVQPNGVHGSSLSLASTSSSIYSATAEERYQAEIRKLHREVEAYREKVTNLTAQQSTYTSMVHAFENTLQGMIQRVQTLQNDSQRKDVEVTDLRQKIDVLREMGQAAGINVEQIVRAGSPAIQRRHTFNEEQQIKNGLQRQPSIESVVSTVSQKSSLSNSSKGSKTDKPTSAFERGSKNPKKGWIRSSFSRAFKGKKNKEGCSMSDVEESGLSADERSTPSSVNAMSVKSARESTPCQTEEIVEMLKNELQEKDNKLTDVRLEALTTAHQVDQLKEALTRLRTENVNLKLNNERLSTVVQQVAHHGSHSSLPLISDNEGDSMSDSGGGHAMSDVGYITRNAESTRHSNTRRVLVSVCCDLRGHNIPNEDAYILVGYVGIASKTTWDRLDGEVNKVFNEYLHRVDPVGNLNLNSVESMLGYNVGNSWRNREGATPMHTPAQCAMTTEGSSVQIVLKGTNQCSVDSLAFETLMPKGNLERYVRQLQKERRLVLCGSCGTGKTHLAHKLAYYLSLCAGRDPQIDDSAIEVIELNEGDPISKTTDLLRQRLGSAFRRCQEANAKSPGPLVIILDNLHNVNALSDVFSRVACPKPGPYIICTMNQSTSISSLQIDHGFRFVIWANHMDPVKLFLSRYLRRRLVESECSLGIKASPDFIRVLDFLPKVWTHLNEFLTTVNSSDVTIGPRLFVACPMNMQESRIWFIDLWNRTIHPYILQAAGEGLSMYGKRGSLEDPSDLVCEHWPWNEGDVPEAVLHRLTPQHLKAEQSNKNNMTKADPLMVLMRLQEQAKLSELAGES